MFQAFLSSVPVKMSRHLTLVKHAFWQIHALGVSCFCSAYWNDADLWKTVRPLQTPSLHSRLRRLSNKSELKDYLLLQIVMIHSLLKAFHRLRISLSLSSTK